MKFPPFNLPLAKKSRLFKKSSGRTSLTAAKKSLKLTDCSGEHYEKLPFPKRSEQNCMLSLTCVLHCLWEADCRLAGEKKTVPALGSPSTFPEAEASCSHTFASLHSRTLLGPSAHLHPFPAVPQRKASLGASCFHSRSTSFPCPGAACSWPPASQRQLLAAEGYCYF